MFPAQTFAIISPIWIFPLPAVHGQHVFPAFQHHAQAPSVAAGRRHLRQRQFPPVAAHAADAEGAPRLYPSRIVLAQVYGKLVGQAVKCVEVRGGALRNT